MKRMSEVIASTIVKQCADNPQAAFDAILKLVKDNKRYRAALLKASEHTQHWTRCDCFICEALK